MTVNFNFEIISEKHITTNIDIIEEILDMPTEGEVQMNLPLENADCKVQMNLTNIDCMGHNDLCKNKSHCAELHSELFCVTGNDLDYVDIDDLY